ncbi:MAG: glycerol kinase GlpK [Burkholderiales bacterium]
MNKRILVAFDQGTTSCRTLVYDAESKKIIAVSQKEFSQKYPKPGWVEHDAEEIWDCQLSTYRDAVKEADLSVGDIAAIGITNQRETVVVWEKQTGKPVCNAIVWQCRRTADICDRLKSGEEAAVIRGKTGLVIDAYFSASKIKWILDNIPGAKEKAKKGELLAGTMDSWLVWKMTGGRVHVTDYTNASRTMLFNIHTLEWDEELLDMFGVPASMLPKVLPSSGVAGITDEFMGAGIPIGGIAGDQHAALFGQNCTAKGSAKNTYGTGCFILMNTGETPIESKNSLLTTIAWGLKEKSVCYALEGSVFIAGAVLQWIRDELKMVKHVREIDEAAEQTPDSGGVYIVPAFTGLGAPYWDMYARGTIVGLTRGAGRNHLLRAAIESIAYQSRDVFEAMKLDSGLELRELKVDGGASASDVLMQFQADILNCEVLRPSIRESTAMGAIYLAGLAVGVWSGLDEIKSDWVLERSFKPAMTESRRRQLYAGWKKAVLRARDWVEK